MSGFAHPGRHFGQSGFRFDAAAAQDDEVVRMPIISQPPGHLVVGGRVSMFARAG
jgi:hypothetical protein